MSVSFTAESSSNMEPGLIHQNMVVPGTLPGVTLRIRTQPTRAVSSPLYHDSTPIHHSLSTSRMLLVEVKISHLTVVSQTYLVHPRPAISTKSLLFLYANVTEVNESTTDHFNLSDGAPTIESRTEEDAAAEVLDNLKTGACLQYPEPVQSTSSECS